MSSVSTFSSAHVSVDCQKWVICCSSFPATLMTFVHVHGAPKFGCLNIQYYNDNNRLMALYQGQPGSRGTRTLRNINPIYHLSSNSLQAFHCKNVSLISYRFRDTQRQNVVTLKSGLEVTEGHRNCYHVKAWVRFLIYIPL